MPKLTAHVIASILLAACGVGQPTAEPSPEPSMRVVAIIDVNAPRAVQVAQGALWVLQSSDVPQRSHAEPILRIDPASNTVVAGIEQNHASMGSGWQLAEAPEGLWVATPDGASAPDFGPGVSDDEIPTDIRRAFRNGKPLRADLVQEDVAGGLVLVDPHVNKVKRMVFFLDWGPDSIASTDVGLWLTVLSGTGNGSTLVLFDPERGALRTVRRNHYFQLSEHDGSLWGCGERVERLDASTGEVLSRTWIQADDCAVTSSAVWVATGHELVRLDPSSGRIVARVRIEGGVNDVAANDEHVVVGAWRNGIIHHVDPASNEVVASVDLGPPNEEGNRVSMLAVGLGSAWVINKGIVRLELA